MRRRENIGSRALAALMVIGLGCSHFAVAAPVPPQNLQNQTRNVRATTPRGLPAKKPVVKSFARADYLARARAYFAAGNYEKALLFANADLRSSPGRKSALLMMAQSYYRLGRASEAAKVFLILSPDDLTSDAAIDCTLAMFATRRYKQATKAWLHVAPDHPYRDIARFYAGVSYMHLNLYAKASQLLRLAIRLPANLKSDRRRILTEVDQLLERQRRGEFVGGQAYSYQTQQRYYQIPVAPPVEPVPQAAPGPGGAGKPPAATAAAVPKKSEPPAPAKPGFVFSATPEVSYETKATKQDFNGYSQLQGSSKTPAFTAPVQMKYSGKPRSFGGQPTVTVNVTPGYSDTEGTLTRSSLVAQESDPGAIQSVTKEDTLHAASATLKNGLDLLYPVSEAIDLGLGYKDEHEFVDASQKKENAVNGPRFNMVIDGDTYKGELNWSMYDTTSKLVEDPKIKTVMTTSGTLTRNGETSVTRAMATYVQTNATAKSGEQSRMGLDLNWDKTWEDVSLGLSGGYVSKTAYSGTVLDEAAYTMNAARTQENIGVSLKYTVGFGLALTGTGKLSQFSDYESRQTNEAKESVVVSSTGSIHAFGMSGALALGSYVSLEAAYNYTKRNISVGDAAFETAILKAAVSEVSESSLKLGIRYPF